jgi:Lipoprotein LpqB beta-propeller domain
VGSGTVTLEVGFEAPAAVRDALAAMGRTEDIRLSPNGRRLAFAGYGGGRIAIADVEFTSTASGPEVAVTSLDWLASPDLREPHGVDFVDDDTLVVADRIAGIFVFRLPGPGGTGGLTRIYATDGGPSAALDAPGSVVVRSNGSGHEVLLCENWENKILRHTLVDGALAPGEVVAHKWLDVPDGLTISEDGRWLAVSNHNAHSVFIYVSSALGEHSDPVAILRGVRYPHGLRFTRNSRRLVVADAGAPRVHVFVSPDGGWRGVGYPTASIRVMDDEAFALGHREVQDGGPKGIDLDPRTNVLVVTSEFLPLAFFDLTEALDESGDGLGDEALVEYELHVLSEVNRIKDAGHAARASLAEVQQTKAWRLTKPMRGAYAVMRRLRSRRRGQDA